MTLKEKISDHKKAITVYLIMVTIVAMVFISNTAYQKGFEDGRSEPYLDPFSNNTTSNDQWFAVNHSFLRVYKWEITGNDTWRFYWEWVDFENMTGLHLIQFPPDGNMWTEIPFGLVKTPDTAKITKVNQI